MNQAVQIKTNTPLTADEIELLKTALTCYAHLEGGEWILDIKDRRAYARRDFVNIIGFRIASAWARDPDKLFIKYDAFRTAALGDDDADIEVYTKTKAGRDIGKKKVSKPKLKTVHVDQGQTYDHTRADMFTRRLSILNVKSVDLSAVGCGGGLRVLGWAEISAALSFARLDNISYLLVRVVHCGDVQSMQLLNAAVTAEFVLRDRIRGNGIWCGNQDDVRKLVNIALYDYLQLDSKRPVSGRERAKIFGLAEATWRDRRYSRIVDDIIDRLTGRYDVARTKIYDQLTNDSLWRV